MATQLMKNEKVLKEYEYAKSGNLLVEKDGYQKTLTATNKRLIHEVTVKKSGRKSSMREEMLLEDVQLVKSSYRANARPGVLAVGILIFCLSIVLAIVSYSLEGSGASSFVAIIVGFIIFVPFLIAYLASRQADVTVSIYTKGYLTDAMEDLSADKGRNLTNAIRRGKKVKALKVKVNREVAETMVEEIGTLVFGVQQGDYT